MNTLVGMGQVSERMVLYVDLARARNAKRMQFSALIAIVIAVLLKQTQWLALRPGLLILLVGQLVAAILYFYRRGPLAKDLSSFRNDKVDSPLLWFDEEARFVSRASAMENILRAIGFVVLAYGFWSSTGSLVVALMLGVVYPVAAYLGIARRNDAALARNLAGQRADIAALLQVSDAPILL